MKYLPVILASLLLAACTDEQDNGKALSPKDIKNPNTLSTSTDSLYPEMTFERTHHDFGAVTQGEVVAHNFEFTNTGATNLIIGHVESTCGCTVPEYPRTPIAPGEKGTIRVEFNSANRSNRVKKTVTITANTNPNLISLTIEAFVEQD
jgi:hypothetical protein